MLRWHWPEVTNGLPSYGACWVVLLLVDFASGTALLARGGTFPNSLYQATTFMYKLFTDTTVVYEPQGSGAGQKAIIANQVDFAASDSVLSVPQYTTTPDLQMYPAVAGAVVLVYNIDGLTSQDPTLILSRELLSSIFLGDITSFNDSGIWNSNPSLQGRLPNAPINLVVRSDSSGTTEIFTKALSSFSSNFSARIGGQSLPKWCEEGYGTGAKVSVTPLVFGLMSSQVLSCIKWASGTNQTLQYLMAYETWGILSTVSQTPNSIGYVVMYDGLNSGLPVARLKNKAGQIVTPSVEAISYAVLDKGGDMDQYMNANLVDASSSLAWPIAGYTYWVVRKTTMHQDCAARTALVSFLRWFFTAEPAQEAAKRLGYSMLPTFIRDNVLLKIEADVMCVAADNSTYLAWSNNALAALVVTAPETVQPVLLPLFEAYAGVNSTVSFSATGSDTLSVIARINASVSAPGTLQMFALDTASVLALQTAGALARGGLVTFPFYQYAVLPIYHLKGLDTNNNGLGGDQGNMLALNSTILAGMWLGTVTAWNDPMIQSLNQNLTKPLPSTPITVVAINGSCMSTTVFTKWLSSENAAFAAKYGVSDQLAPVGVANVKWVQCLSGAGPSAAVAYQDGAIGYWLRSTAPITDVADLVHLGVRITQNSNTTEACAAAADRKVLPGGQGFYYDPSLQYSLRGCWPLTETVQLGMPMTVQEPYCAQAQAATRFMYWMYTGGKTSVPMATLQLSPASAGDQAAATKLFKHATCGDDPLLTELLCEQDDYLLSFGSCMADTNSITASYQWRSPQTCIVGQYNGLPPLIANIACDHTMAASSAGIATIALGLAGAIGAVALTALYLSGTWKTYSADHNGQQKKISRLFFVGVVCLMSVGLNLVGISFVGTHTDFSCAVNRWGLFTCLPLLFITLLLRVWNVSRIFFQKTGTNTARHINPTPWRWTKQITLLFLPVLLVLVAWTVLDVPRREVYTERVNSSDLQRTRCSRSHNAFLYVIDAYLVILMGMGVYLAIRVKGSSDFARKAYNFKNNVGEASSICNCIYTVGIAFFFYVLLTSLANLNPTALTIVEGVMLCVLSGTIPIVFVLFPDVRMRYLNRKLWDEVMLRAKRTSSRGAESGSQARTNDSSGADVNPSWRALNMKKVPTVRMILDAPSLWRGRSQIVPDTGPLQMPADLARDPSQKISAQPEPSMQQGLQQDCNLKRPVPGHGVQALRGARPSSIPSCDPNETVDSVPAPR